jgi:POT family proton-dependent oligopeptide transporter
MDPVDRSPLRTRGVFNPKAEISTYYLVGPMYFLFFIGVMCLMGVIYIFFAMAYKEQDHVRT